MIEDLLRVIGAPGWLVIIASTGFGLYHFRNVLGLAAVLGSWLRMLGVGIALFVIASSGVIPGVDIDVSVQVGVLVDIATSVWEIGRDVAGVAL